MSQTNPVRVPVEFSPDTFKMLGVEPQALNGAITHEAELSLRKEIIARTGYSLDELLESALHDLIS
jgi:hypothetical protein